MEMKKPFVMVLGVLTLVGAGCQPSSQVSDSETMFQLEGAPELVYDLPDDMGTVIGESTAVGWFLDETPKCLELEGNLRGKAMYDYIFAAKDPNSDKSLMVEVLPNVSGHDSLADFKQDYMACNSVGIMWMPEDVTDEWILLTFVCDGDQGCIEARKSMGPITLK